MRIHFVNNLRGIAALIVLFSHYLWFFWIGRDRVARFINAPLLNPDIFPTPEVNQSIFNLTNFLFGEYGLGGYGVDLFFLISGFVIPFSVKKTNLLGFLGGRALRIIPTYLICFTFSIFLIWLCSTYFHSPFPYEPIEVVLNYLPGVRDVMALWNIDIVIWSLEIEVKFYLLCALMMPLFKRNSILIFLPPIILGCVAIYMQSKHITGHNELVDKGDLTVAYYSTSKYLCYMFIGVIFHYVHEKKIPVQLAWLLGLVLLLIFLVINIIIGPENSYLYVAILAVMTFGSCYRLRDKITGESRWINFFAKISYPLYAIHAIFGLVVIRIVIENSFSYLFTIIFITSASILLSYIIHLFIERPSQNLGKKIAEKWR